MLLNLFCFIFISVCFFLFFFGKALKSHSIAKRVFLVCFVLLTWLNYSAPNKPGITIFRLQIP